MTPTDHGSELTYNMCNVPPSTNGKSARSRGDNLQTNIPPSTNGKSARSGGDNLLTVIPS